MTNSVTNERVHFRLIVCPECKHQLCWVNPRLPSYCPECGKHIYPAVRSSILINDDNAALRYHPHTDGHAYVREAIINLDQPKG